MHIVQEFKSHFNELKKSNENKKSIEIKKSLHNSNEEIDEYLKKLIKDGPIWSKQKNTNSFIWKEFGEATNQILEIGYRKYLQFGQATIKVSSGDENLEIDCENFLFSDEKVKNLKLRRKREIKNNDKTTKVILTCEGETEDKELIISLQSNIKDKDCSDVIYYVRYTFKNKLINDKELEILSQYNQIEISRAPYTIKIPKIKKEWAIITIYFEKVLPKIIEFPISSINKIKPIELDINDIGIPFHIQNKYPNYSKIKNYENYEKKTKKFLHLQFQKIVNKIIQLSKEENPYLLKSTGEKTFEFFIRNGFSGYSYFLWKYSNSNLCKSESLKNEILQLAKKLLNLAVDENQNDYLYIGFLHGISGIYALQSVVYYNLNELDDFQNSIENLLNISDHFIVSEMFFNDFMYGFTGYLASILFVLNYIPHTLLNIEKIISIFELCIQFLLNSDKKTCIVNYSFRNIEYSGPAFGLSGVLFILMHIYQFFIQYNPNYSIKNLKSKILLSLDYLISHFITDDFDIIGRIDDFDSNIVTQWCKGCTGIIPTFLKAYQCFRDDKYLDYCKKMTGRIWKLGILRKGFGLCHGIYGNAFAFLQMYEVTNDITYLYQAYQFLGSYSDKRIRVNIASFFDNSRRTKGFHYYSIMEGISGEGCVLMDILENPKKPKFPGYWNDLYEPK